MKKITRAIKPAGLIDGAMTYSLYLDDRGLFCIKTGPATRELKEMKVKGLLNELLAKFIVDKVAAKAAKKVLEGEAKVREDDLDTQVQEKGNVFVAVGNIKGMSVSKNKLGYPMITIETADKPLEFFFREQMEETVEAFTK